MINQKKVIVVLPAYNAEKTLVKTYNEIPLDVVDEVILTDDCSSDRTVQVAKELGVTVLVHSKNRGYGGNQKTCYTAALKAGGDIIVMIHPDYQYTPKLITALASMVAYDIYDVVLGSRILGNTALSGGMPVYKYVANRFLTFIQNVLINQKLSEYHTGLRVFSKDVLTNLPLEENSDDFIFDNQMLVQSFLFGFRVGEVSCPTKYFTEASSINFKRSVKYGFGCILDSLLYITTKWDVYTPDFLSEHGKRINWQA